MKSLFFIFTVSVLFCSCSSTNGSANGGDGKVKLKENATGKVVQVDLVDKNELRRQGFDPDSQKYEKALLNTGFVTKKPWYKMQEEYKDYNMLISKPVSELKAMLNTADAAKATLLIEVLSQKGATAVSVLVERLNDKRAAVFKGDDKIFWYEEKNKPAEELELRLFAAMHLEKMVNTSPYGVSFDFHKLRTDEGPVDVLYAVKGSYAVNKDDVCKNWLKWWSVYGSDYK